MTANDLVTDVLRRISIIAESATPTAEQGADAVTRLNDMMAEMAEDEIDLGWNPKATTASDVDLSQGYVNGVKAMLALRLCECYGVDVPPLLASEAQGGYERLLRNALNATAKESRMRHISTGTGSFSSSRILTG